MRAPNRKIVLGMPGYGKQTAAAGRAFWRACRDMSGVWNYYQCGSLLASNFNQLWCLALNLSHSGEQVDYFAMLHDDVAPEDFWLDDLIDELEANQLDILGTVVPIKDSRGLTSLALHRDGDNWMQTRLSMHDVYQLPETFTSEDVGAPLLLNTGCWVAKWNQEWCRQVSFTINDRIVFNRAANRYQAQTEPEDWYFSRLCHEMHLKIGATRKIKLRHQGETEFTNEKPWGRNVFDVESTNRSPVPNAFPQEISGWLLPEEAKCLAELARGKRVLEIGAYCGLSTVCMGRTAKHVTSVDYWDGRGTPTPQDTLSQWRSNMARYGLTDKTTAINLSEHEVTPDGPFELVFIDGAHDYESVSYDIARALPRLVPGGLLAFHDYKHPCHDGVEKAINELIEADGAKLLNVVETIAVVQPSAEIPMEVC